MLINTMSELNDQTVAAEKHATPAGIGKVAHCIAVASGKGA